MKKKTLIALGLIASVFMGFTASADPVNIARDVSRSIAIPGLSHPKISPLNECQAISGILRNRLEARDRELEEKQQQISELEDQVARLTPGTCQNRCASRPDCEESRCSGLDALYSYGDCVQSCHLNSATSGFVEDDSRTRDAFSRW